MKKVLSIFALGLIMISMCMSFASAGIAENIQKGIEGTYTALEPTLRILIGGTQDSADIFLATLVLAIIIFSVVWVAIGRMKFFNDNDWAMWLVTLAVSLLSIRWITEVELIKTIILPYSTLGVALTAGIPFVIYFFVVKDFNSSLAKRVAWVFFAAIFIGLWFVRQDQIDEFNWIYLATAGAALLVILLDKKITKFLKTIEIEEEAALRNSHTQQNLKDLERKLRQRWEDDGPGYVSHYDKSKTSDRGFLYDMKVIKDKIAKLSS